MVSRIKSLCSQRHINFSQLERRLNFANGSIAKSKEDKIGAIRVKAIADYFGVSMEYILCGTQPNEVHFSDDEREIISAYRTKGKELQDAIRSMLGLRPLEIQKRDIG